MRTWRSTFLVAFVCLVAVLRAHAQVVVSGQALTVTTANATAIFQGPDLVGFANAATGESYLKSAPASPLLNLETMAGTGQPLTASAWN